MTEVAIDIGAEFVDIVCRRNDSCAAAKFAIAGRSDSEAILHSLDRMLESWPMKMSALSHIRIGSTGTVNTLLARRGARIGLLTNAGFGDTIYLGRQDRADLYAPVARSPSPTYLVDRRDVVEIGGRIDAGGREVEPLDLSAIERAVELFSGQPVEAIAVCLLFSHVNAAHEQRCRELLEAALPNVCVCLSCEIDGNMREYERTVAVCLEAYLRPQGTRTIREIEIGLGERGFDGTLSFAEARGALVDAPTALKRISSLVASGPAMSAKCAAVLARSLGARRALAVDIGSASTDIALVEDGAAATVNYSRFAGVPMRLPMCDVESDALGGSSRVNSDVAGSVSFQAEGDGEHNAMLSDAVAWLGWIPYADARGANDRIERAARQRRSTPREIARSIVEAAEMRIADRLLTHAVSRNVDPATVPLVAMGGLGGILATGIAERLGMLRVAVPSVPSVGGALGLLLAEPLCEAEVPVNAEAAELDDDELAVLSRGLVKDAGSAVMANGATDKRRAVFFARMAANRHMHAMEFAVGATRPTSRALRHAFCEYHLRQYGFEPAAPGYVFALRARLDRADAAPTHLPLVEAPARTAYQDGDAAHGVAEVIHTPAGSIIARKGWRAECLPDGNWLVAKGPGNAP